MKTLLLALTLMLTACGEKEAPAVVTPAPVAPQGRFPATIRILSDAFAEGAAIPMKHSCDGENVSPPLRWHLGPKGTVSYVVLVSDPDSPEGRFVHWVNWNLSVNELAEGQAGDGTQGANGFGQTGWGGPCPPPGEDTHRYVFGVFALDVRLDLPPGSTRDQVMNALRGHVVGRGALTGRYGR